MAGEAVSRQHRPMLIRSAWGRILRSLRRSWQRRRSSDDQNQKSTQTKEALTAWDSQRDVAHTATFLHKRRGQEHKRPKPV
jgi:hypothetical protein